MIKDIFLFIMFLWITAGWFLFLIPPTVFFKKIRKSSTEPKWEFGRYTMYSAVDVTIKENQWRVIDTGIGIGSSYLRIPFTKVVFSPFGTLRSFAYIIPEFAIRKGLRLHAYDEIIRSSKETYKVCLFNHNNYPIRIHPGDPVVTVKLKREPYSIFFILRS